MRLTQRLKASSSTLSHVSVWLLIIGVVGVFIACSDPLIRMGPTLRNEQLMLADASIPLNTPSVQMRWVHVARQVPGFGGFWFDSAGNHHVYLVNRRDSARARSALSEVFTNNRGFVRSLGAPHRLIVEQGKYDFRELLGWMQTLSHQFHRVQGYQSLAIRHKLNKVRAGVVSLSAKNQLESIAKDLGIPDDALIVVVEEPIKYNSRLSDSAAVKMGGYKTFESDFNSCTLGININGGYGFLTASHCTGVRGPDSPSQKVYFYQPAFGIDRDIGSETSDPPWQDQETIPCCDYIANKCRYSDAAIITYDAEDRAGSAGQGLIAKTTARRTGQLVMGSDTVSGNLVIAQEYFYAATGSIVDKIGATTGWTYGEVAEECALTSVGGWQVVCHVNVEGGFAYEGDSGGPAFHRLSGDTVQWAGIEFAGGTNNFRYSHAEMILTELQGISSYWR
jgi:hypothetical protein